MKAIIVSAAVLLLATLTLSKEPDYYWRDYNGNVPQDAVLGYEDEFGRKTYIGNVVVQGGGVYIGTLYPGNNKIVVAGPPGSLVHNRDKFIQILCSGNKSMFKWVKTSENSLHQIPYHLVKGGHENANPGVLYIGRTLNDGEMIIGKVIGYKPNEDSKMYYPSKGREMSTTSYEVLVYNQPQSSMAPVPESDDAVSSYVANTNLRANSYSGLSFEDLPSGDRLKASDSNDYSNN